MTAQTLSADRDSQPMTPNHGPQVVLAGLGINLALGILYSWSVFSKSVPETWHWNATDKSWPYAIACLVFSLVMVPAGRLQDRIGPRFVATVGGVLVGMGMILSSFSITPWGYVLGFGVLAGAGFAFGYAAATPAAVKWFPATQTGMIAGIVVAGFGMANIYAAPLTSWLIASYSQKSNPTIGLQQTFLTLGIAFLLVVSLLAQFLRVPPQGRNLTQTGNVPATGHAVSNATPSEMLGTWQFYLLWFMYFCGAGAGLMVIGKLSDLAKEQTQLDLGYALVAALGVGNGGGRVLAGMLSDRIGRRATLCLCLVMQAGLMLLLSQAKAGTPLATIGVMAMISALVGAFYGANLALFPAITKDYYGMTNFGMNYGLVFTAWGIGGFVLAMIAGRLHDAYQVYTYSFYIAATLLVVAAVGTNLLRPPRKFQPAHA
jgi:MFS transporter, OFA family, oxalate/formate antiporter